MTLPSRTDVALPFRPAATDGMRGFPQPRVRPTALGPLLLIGGCLVISLLAMDWIAGLSLVVLWGGWKYLSRQPGPPVIAAAFAHQWLQVTIAVFYAVLTGRKVIQMQTSDYRPMILIGLASIITMFVGFYLTAGFRRRSVTVNAATRLPFEFSTIAIAYGVSVVLSGGLATAAWSLPGLTQIVLVLGMVRYLLLFLVVRRLAAPRLQWGWIVLVLLAEVVIGFTGFFADFRQPIAIVGIALLGASNGRSIRTWILLAFLAVLAAGAGVIWTTVKPIIRIKKDYATSQTGRLRTIALLTDTSLTGRTDAWQYHADTTVSRIWAVYYPSLALARVPSVVPHEEGALLWFTIKHILTPRFLFPDKPDLPSDSEKVRKYSGVWVSGREARTSYAFGYAAESYVDFGVPLMFLPIFVFGALMGAAYKILMRSLLFDELRAASAVVIFWSILSSFEVSWVMMVGFGLTQLVVLGTAAVVADRVIGKRGRRVATTTAGIRAVGRAAARI